MEPRSLRTKFIVVIVAVYLAIGAVTLYAFARSTSRIIDDFALSFATKEALLGKNKIISCIDREVALARKMADDPTLVHWAAHEKESGRTAGALEELESYRKSFRGRSFFVALAGSRHYYIPTGEDRSTRIEVATLDAAKPADKWFFETLRDVDDYALNLDYNSLLGEAKVWINAVMRGKGGEKVGVCGSGLELTDFFNGIVQTRENGVSTILIDRSGVIQAHEDRRIVEHNARERAETKKLTIFGMLGDPGNRERLRKAVDALATGKGEVDAFPAVLEGKKYLLAVSAMQGIGWFNVVLVDVSSVISMREFLPIGATLFLSLLLVIVAIAILMNRMVLAPLSGLTAASRQVAGGRYDIVLPVTRRDEIGELTGSFNTMTATVLDYVNNLEEKVRERTDALSAANRQLEASQARIMESIRYARMIQESILPDRERLVRSLGDHFVFYRPKELVGGDFYHLRECGERFLLACVDCTGHGVPGAFMTMAVHSVLSHLLDIAGCDDPARILSELNRTLRQTLQMREVDAGLDIALCTVDRPAGQIVFAGAGLSLFIVSGGKATEIRGDRQRVGYKGARLDYEYRNRVVAVSAGDACYLTTDGLLDEPGGEKGYGFGTPRLKAMLARCADGDMAQQAGTVDRTLADYRGERGSRDDVTLIGFRV